MWKIILLGIVQSSILSGGQILLKMALNRQGKYSLSLKYLMALAVDFYFILCTICYIGGTLLWIYILKNFKFSIAYPMISLSYVMGMIAAVIIFKEDVSIVRWIGVLLIVGGCCLIAK